MFGLLVIFGQLWGKPWYGENTGLMEGLPTGLRDVELTGGRFLSVPGPVAAQRHPVSRSTWAMNHSVRAAARTKRNVLAPMMRCRLRHWSCPSPSKALLSRMAISTAQRWPYARTISSALKGEIGGEKGFDGWGWFSLSWPCGGSCAMPAQHRQPARGAQATPGATGPPRLGSPHPLRWGGATTP